MSEMPREDLGTMGVRTYTLPRGRAYRVRRLAARFILVWDDTYIHISFGWMNSDYWGSKHLRQWPMWKLPCVEEASVINVLTEEMPYSTAD